MRPAQEHSINAETGAIALVRALESIGAEVVFGLPGVHNLDVWAALEHSSLRLVGVRHEQTAVYAADGHARAGGKLGVAATTSGPGAANALAATGEANEAGSPVLIIATDIAASLRREGVHRGVLHETRDQGAMFAPVVKRVIRVGPGQSLEAAVRLAAGTALAPPTGPVYIEIPTDLLGVPEPDMGYAEFRPDPGNGTVQPKATGIPAAVEMIEASKRPLIWVGGGAVKAGAGPAISDLAERLVAPVIETYMARGILSTGNPCRIGMPPHQPQVGKIWDCADLVIAVGTDFDGMMTQNWAMPQPPKLVAINVDPSEASKNYRADLALIGDARAITGELASAVDARPGLSELERRLTGIRDEVGAEIAEANPEESSFLTSLEQALGNDTIVFADMCIPGYWTAAFHPFERPRHLAYPVGWGTLGFAFPASLGAAIGQPDPVLCVCGDGGFLFAAGELATMAQEQIPLTLLIVDDGGYGMLRYDQKTMGQNAVGVDLVSPDWQHLAAAFGLSLRKIDSLGQPLADALEEELSNPGPSILVASANLTPPVTTSPRWYRSVIEKEKT